MLAARSIARVGLAQRIASSIKVTAPQASPLINKDTSQSVHRCIFIHHIVLQYSQLCILHAVFTVGFWGGNPMTTNQFSKGRPSKTRRGLKQKPSARNCCSSAKLKRSSGCLEIWTSERLRLLNHAPTISNVQPPSQFM